MSDNHMTTDNQTPKPDGIDAAAALLRAAGWYLMSPIETKRFIERCQAMTADLRAVRQRLVGVAVDGDSGGHTDGW